MLINYSNSVLFSGKTTLDKDISIDVAMDTITVSKYD